MFKQLICVLLLMSYVIAPARAEQGCPYTTQIAYADGHFAPRTMACAGKARGLRLVV